jgi:hypothetical protein
MIQQLYARTSWHRVLSLTNIGEIAGGSTLSPEAIDAIFVFSEVKCVRLPGCDLTTESCRRLSQLRNVEWLDLSFNEVGDDAVGWLRDLPKLSDLNLSHTAVTGRCFDKEWKCRHVLQNLSLSSTSLDWQGLRALKQFDHLASLEVDDCARIAETSPEKIDAAELARDFSRLVDLRGIRYVFRDRNTQDAFVRNIPQLKTAAY